MDQARVQPLAQGQARAEPEAQPSAHDGAGAFESFPLTRPEYITAMVHFYRGEMYRSQVWRTRLDTTTNWAVVTAAGMISFAFSSPEHSHVTVLLANITLFMFLSIEARRYRYFAVYRARVRMIEENFYLPLIRRSLVSPMDAWRDVIASDLDAPKFKNTYLEALLFRMRRNYAWLFGIVLVAWIAKLFMHPGPATHVSDLISRMAIGPIPSWLILALALIFFAGVTIPLITSHGRRAAADEIEGVEREMTRWVT